MIDAGDIQGEVEDALNNIAIGQFMLAGPSDVPSGSPVLLSLTLDLDGSCQSQA